jgi:MurNAc alpha-1-phosphate uridylyltransferase
MKAFVLAAGYGKRMGSYTKNLPKPLLSIQDIKLLDYTLYMIQKWKISEIIVNTHYLSDKIEEYLRSFKSLNIQISKEERILGTGGGLYTGIKKFGIKFKSQTKLGKAHENLQFISQLDDETYIILNPDTIIFPESNSFFPNFPSKKNELCDFEINSLIHLYLRPLPEGASYTGLFLKDNKVYFEKIKDSKPCYYIGLAVIKPVCMESSEFNYEIDQPFELVEVFKNLSKRGLLTGEIFRGSAIDIGEKEFYETIQKNPDFFQGKQQEIVSIIRSMKF